SGDPHGFTIVVNARERLVAADESKTCVLELGLVLAIDKRALEEGKVGGEEIVPKAGQGDGFSTNRASYRAGPLEHHDATASASQAKRCHQPVMAGSYDDRIGVSHCRGDPLSRSQSPRAPALKLGVSRSEYFPALKLFDVPHEAILVFGVIGRRGGNTWDNPMLNLHADKCQLLAR